MEKNQYNLGLVSVSFRQHSPKEISEAAKAAGLSCIEWGSDVHAPYNDTEKLNEISRLQKEYGIFCSSYGTYFRIGVNPTEELQCYIDAAKILGTNILRVWCYNKTKADMTQAEHDFLINECEKVKDIAEQNNVTVCLECHRDTYTENRADTVFLMEQINSEHFCMYWQPFQWQTKEENLAYAETVARYTKHIHVFQWKENLRFSLNDGIEEWRNYLSKFSVPRTLLLEFMPDDCIDSLEAEVKALKTIIGESI